TNYQATYSNADYTSDQSQYPDVRAKINANRIDDAETILDGIPKDVRNAEWYYLKGQIQQKRGWFDEAYKNYSSACQMDPSNIEYTNAFNSLNNNSNGGYKTSGKTGGGCSSCDLCSGLLCADCCCECFGGDIIPCC
ncbi:MAG: molecular chaperone DnaJ, partial [Oscillospiraceae bacterium]